MKIAGQIWCFCIYFINYKADIQLDKESLSNTVTALDCEWILNNNSLKMNTKGLLNSLLFCLIMTVSCPLINSQDWLEIKNFFPSDGNGGDYTGNSVCIDENTAVVGAYRTIHPTFSTETGSAYILYRNQDGGKREDPPERIENRLLLC